MSPRELRQKLKSQRAALRAQLADRRRAVEAEVSKMPVVQTARRQRRLRRAVVTVIVLVLLSLIRCDCANAPTAPNSEDAGMPPVAVVTPPPPTKSRPKAPTPPTYRGDVTQPPRAEWNTLGRASPDWLEAFRLQVAARSPRLAQCFQGTERPGALRWSAAVNPSSGSVADQQFETVGTGADLTADQRQCLTRALANPVYRVDAPPAGQPLLNRFSMVIEF